MREESWRCVHVHVLHEDFAVLKLSLKYPSSSKRHSALPSANFSLECSLATSDFPDQPASESPDLPVASESPDLPVASESPDLPVAS
ncbi:hypothetical protein AOLI_G00097990 [Acnodon oligacanthus]